MNTLTFLIRAFGFENWQDFKVSSFGFIHKDIVIGGGVVAFFTSVLDAIPCVFGVQYAFFFAYVMLIIFEWLTGILASLKRGEKHESRKLGRMLFKVLIYSVLVALLHQMTKIEFPYEFMEHFSPFKWLYWLMITIIIWQLWVSVLENLSSLGFRFAKVALKVINKNFENKLNVKDDDKE